MALNSSNFSNYGSTSQDTEVMYFTERILFLKLKKNKNVILFLCKTQSVLSFLSNYQYKMIFFYFQIIIPANNSRELTSICDNVSTNIYTINSCIKNLKTVIGQVGTQRDTQGLRDQIHVWQLSANEVVKATPKDIARLTVLGRTANKQQKLQIEKITSHFKEAVQAYGQIQQVKSCKSSKNPSLLAFFFFCFR